MSKQMRVINGVEVCVTVCKPSRRKASSSIQGCRHTGNSVGANWVAKEKGLSCKKEDKSVGEKKTKS